MEDQVLQEQLIQMISSRLTQEEKDEIDARPSSPYAGAFVIASVMYGEDFDGDQMNTFATDYSTIYPH